MLVNRAILRKFLSASFFSTLLLFAGATFVGCPEKNDNAIEEAGEAVEEGAEEAGEAVEEGAEEVTDEVDDATTN